MEFETKISPCPFSPQYRVPESQAWQSLTVYFLYRLTLGSVLVFLFFLGSLPASLGRHEPLIYAVVSCVYLGSIFVSAPLLFLKRRPGFAAQAQFQVLADLSMIPFIMHASGGVESGVGVLLAISVAAGGILTGGRCALMFAAVASLGVLGEEVYSDLTKSFRDTHLAYAGMLGGAYFGIAILAVVLARRAEQSEAIAVEKTHAVANLERMNAFIIHHLQSGILVIDEQESIRMLNESAAHMLNIAAEPQSLETASPALTALYRAWLQNPDQSTANLSSKGGIPVHVRMTRLGRTWPPVHMIFLEDSALYSARVQQSKLASLGRLTASIAHEIRNPLSAIKHASQLLAECTALEDGDRRLTQIIQDHVTRVNDIVENVLQLSRRGTSRLESISLMSTLERFLRDIQSCCGVDSGTFQLECADGDLEVLVDPSQLKQILENLCTNALRYGNPAAGPIRVRIGRHRGDPCIEVSDHAPPIDLQIAQQMFEPFFTTSGQGSGLGLYIARELAELNQARLEYEPAARGGCFRLCLADAEKMVVAL